MQPVCSKNTPSESQYCSPLLTTIIYEANMQHRDLYGSLYTIENSDVQPWSGFEKWLKICECEKYGSMEIRRPV